VHGASRDIIEQAKAARFSVREEAVDTSMVPGWADNAKCVAVSSNKYTARFFID